MSGANATIVTFNAARVVFGAGASAETGEHLRQLGVTRALVVCDRFVTESGLGERIEASLRAAGVEPVVYDRIVGEPNETLRAGGGRRRRAAASTASSASAAAPRSTRRSSARSSRPTRESCSTT